MDKVSIIKVFEKPFDEELYAAVRQAVDMIGGPKAFASKGDTVLVKPNWWWKRTFIPKDCPSDAYSTTDRRMVVAAARMFSEIGCRVLIGEDPECFLRAEEVMDSFGAQQLADMSGAEALNMRRNGYREIPTKGKLFKTMKVLNDAADADLIVNLPVMKTNFLTTITCCLKNMKGVIPPVEKRAFHQRGLSQGIADLATVVKPRLNIVEALIGNDVWDVANGMKSVGCILAGDNPLSTDAIVARIMDYDPREIEHLQLAFELGVGELDLDRIDLLCESIEEVKRPFTKIPDMVTMIEQTPALSLVQGQVCSACLGSMAMAIAELGQDRFSNVPEIALVGGLGAEGLPGHTNIFVGKCAKQGYEKAGREGLFVGDCPPTCSSVKFALLHAVGERDTQEYYWDHVTLADD